jgi:integrase/recombinase XerD
VAGAEGSGRIEWGRYPLTAEDALARRWVEAEALVGLAHNTVDAYARGVEDFLGFCGREGVEPLGASKADARRYVGDLRRRPGPRGTKTVLLESGAGLSTSTMRQRMTAVRLFYDFLVEEGLRESNPVGRGRYTPGKAYGPRGGRSLVPREERLPWIPNEEQWRALLEAARSEPIRNRFMLALAYDGALRREELCSLRTDDVDPSHRMLRLRAETTKGRRERTVPYSAPTGQLLRAYLAHRGTLSAERGPLFLSESRRNFGQPVMLWTWSKVVRGMALRAGLPQFSTHTLRHLCLTDLARAGWDIHEIARLAGHRNPQTTMQYVHLSGRDLSEKLERGMRQIHAWRTRTLAEAFAGEANGGSAR